VTLYQPPVHSPVTMSAIGGSLLAAVVGSGDRIGDDLRTTLCARFNSEAANLYRSGTQALEAAMRLATAAHREAVGTDPLVALPAYTCFDVATSAAGAGVDVTFYDIDPETLSPDLSSVREALEAGAGILVVTLLYGQPVDWDGLTSLAEEHGCVLIEDAAQAAGARWKGRSLGSLGDLSIFSFGRGKGWGGGGGGALLARGSLAVRLSDAGDWAPGAISGAGVISAGKSLAQYMLGRPGLYGIPARIPMLGLGETVYREPTPLGTMERYQVALTMRTARAAEAEVSLRKKRAGWFRSRFGDRSIRGVTLVRTVDGGEPGFLRMPALLEGGFRGLIRQDSARRAGLAPGYPKPLYDLPQLAERRRGTRLSLPGARQLSRELITLPAHRFVSDAVGDEIMRILGDVHEGTEGAS
jgi:perosamine synthetase